MRDLTEETFGSLTVIGKAEDLNGRARWKCKCNKCGNVLDVLELGLLYRSPKCTCESKKALKDLKGKTIGQFYVIEKAESRRDSTGHLRGYWKCRCNKCGAVSEKSTNIHFDYNGEKVTGSQLAEKLGVKPDLIYSRRKQGWDDEKIMNTPLNTPKIYNLLNGDSESLGQLCKKYKMAEDTVRDRIENGWDITNAFLMPPKTRELFDVDGHPELKNAICFMDNDYNKISQQEYCKRNNISLDIPVFNDNNRPSFKRLIKD